MNEIIVALYKLNEAISLPTNVWNLLNLPPQDK